MASSMSLMSQDQVAEDVINLATGLSEMCMAPKLKIDFTIVEASDENFKEYRHWLNENLPLLFNIFHKNETILVAPCNASLTFRINFVRIICEQSSTCDLFKSNNEQILKNIDNLATNYLRKHFLCDDHFLYSIFNVYKDNLNKNMWKQNIGSLYGFLRFCEVLYQDPIIENDESARYTDRCMFLLALATNLSEHYDPVYKTVGIKLFNILLNKMNQKTIEKVNIHEVIYSTAYPNIERVTEEELTILLWDCLYSCVRFSKITDPSKWNKLDDLFSGIIKKIIFQSNLQIKLKLIFYQIKLSAITIKNSDLINAAIDYDYVTQRIEKGETPVNYDELRKLCRSYSSFFTYRWVKQFLSMYIASANEILFMDRKSVLLFLHAVHVSYLISIYSIPPNIIESQLNEFTRKFCESAKANMVTNKNDRDIKKAILSLIHTIAKHRSFEHRDDATTTFDRDIKLIEKIIQNELTL